MTKLEENNINAQMSLLEDISRNYRTILRDIQQAGLNLILALENRKYDAATESFTMPKAEIDKIWEIATTLKDETWQKLGNSSKSAVMENEIKREILKKLKAE